MTDQIQEHVNQLSRIRDRIEELWFSMEPVPGIHLDGNHEEYERLTRAEKNLKPSFRHSRKRTSCKPPAFS